MKSQKLESFLLRTTELICDPGFAHFENLLKEPNLFQIVGRTHFERWHSAFWGWLLDPSGSHLLQSYALQCLLYNLFKENTLKPKSHNLNELAKILPLATLTNVDVTPNERNSIEVGVKGVGRFDIFITAEYGMPSHRTGRINLLIEFKIESSVTHEQSRRYANWLHNNHPNDYNFPIYFLPNLSKSTIETTGDDRWFCISYQSLHDGVLASILAHPNLNEKTKPFVVQYIKNLRTPRQGIKMAITEEEKRVAEALYEKYCEVFDAIFETLVANGTLDQGTSDLEPRGRASGRIAVRIGKKVFSDTTVRTLFQQALKYLVDSKQIDKLPLPWGPSTKRHLLSTNPATHPNGRPFFYPVEYKGFVLESHYARARALAVLGQLCEKLNLDYETIKC